MQALLCSSDRVWVRQLSHSCKMYNFTSKHFGSSRSWYHLSSRRNTVAPSLCRTFCLFVLCLSVTLFFPPQSLCLSASPSLSIWSRTGWATWIQEAVIVLWKFKRGPRLLFFIIKYWSNNLATNKTQQQTGSAPKISLISISVQVRANWPHTVKWMHKV